LFWDDTNNRLSIGTNAPNRTFVVYNESAPHIQLATSASGITTSSGFQLRIVSNNVLFTNFQASNMVFGNSGATHVTLFNSGNLLVSSTTTTDAGFRLDVNGTARVSGSTTFGTLGAGTGMFWDNTNNRLGIGTASPAYQLSLSGSANIQGATGLNFLVGTRGIFFGLTGSTEISTYLATSPLIFSLNQGSTPVARFSATNGNLLINTTTDAGFRLDVNGTLRVNNTAYSYFVSSSNTAGSGAIKQGLVNGSTFTIDGANGSGPRLGLSSTPTGGYDFFEIGAFASANNFATKARNFRILSTISSVEDARLVLFAGTGNLILQNGGTFTDIASARLAVNSTTQGFLPPRMTTTQKNAIASPATGLMVYDTTLNLISVYNGTTWITL
jgi:hypothetical protein